MRCCPRSSVLDIPFLTPEALDPADTVPPKALVKCAISEAAHQESADAYNLVVPYAGEMENLGPVIEI